MKWPLTTHKLPDMDDFVSKIIIDVLVIPELTYRYEIQCLYFKLYFVYVNWCSTKVCTLYSNMICKIYMFNLLRFVYILIGEERGNWKCTYRFYISIGCMIFTRKSYQTKPILFETMECASTKTCINDLSKKLQLQNREHIFV